MSDPLSTSIEYQHDPLLAERVEKNWEARREMWEAEQVYFPTFGYIAPLPEKIEQFSPTLSHHLSSLKSEAGTDGTPILANSAALQLPIIGRIWGTVRHHAHSLVLFYLNRAVADQTKTNGHLINVVNELTRLTQVQAEEIGRLRHEIEQLQAKR